MKKIMRDHSPDAGRVAEKEDDDFRLFDLDKNRLDEEWVAQPKRFLKAAAQLADAKEDLERAKADLELTDAELRKAILLKPQGFGLEKSTVDAVNAAVVQTDKHQRAERRVIKAKHAVDVLGAMVDALEHRKKALENLVHLRLAEYFSEPRAPRDSEDIKARHAFKRNKQ